MFLHRSDDVTTSLPAVHLSGLFETSCTLRIQGGGNGISSASMNCTGAGLPVSVKVSDDLAPFAKAFQVSSRMQLPLKFELASKLLIKMFSLR